MAHNFSEKPASQADGAKKNKHGADLRADVERQKHAAAVDVPGASRSDRNAALAKAGKWVANSQDDRSANASGRGQRREN